MAGAHPSALKAYPQVVRRPGGAEDLSQEVPLFMAAPDGAGADFFDPSRAMQAWWGLAARNARLIRAPGELDDE